MLRCSPASPLITEEEVLGKSLEKGGSVEKVDRCQDDAISTVIATDPPQEIDYSTFPHLTCNTIEAKRNQANEIMRRLLEASTKENLIAIRAEFSSRCEWVWNKLLTQAEWEKLTAIAQTKQLNLLDEQTSQPESKTIMDVAELLEACDSRELLQEICLLLEITPALLNQACKRLSQQEHAQIQAWLESLSLQIGDRF